MKSKAPQDKRYWRRLTDGQPEFVADQATGPEFPQEADFHDDAMGRRRFMALMGASMALTGLAGCRKPVEKILPYVKQPELVVPGLPLHYATTMPNGLNPVGLLVTTHEGRPTKIEGLPAHPASMGASDFFMQAEVLNLYDPDRSTSLLYRGAERSWGDFLAAWRAELPGHLASGGAGLALLAPPSASPTLHRLHTAFGAAFPSALRAVWEPVSDENTYQAAQLALGAPLRPVYHLHTADVIVCLDHDLLHSDSDHLRHLRAFAERRNPEAAAPMNRLYVVEPSLTLTGGAADHRLRLPAGRIGDLALALARELRAQGLTLPPLPAPRGAEFDGRWLAALAKDLLAHRGTSLLTAGRRQPAWVHAVLFAINEALGSTGKTLTFMPAAECLLPDSAGLARLTTALRAGEVKALIILGGNPAYSAPADLEFAAAMKKAALTIHLSDRRDETSELADWHIPAAHFLEAWGDARAIDGTASIVQPMIEPLHGGHSEIELLEVLTTGKDPRGYDLVRATWQQRTPAVGFEASWRKALHDGLWAGTSLAPAAAVVRPAALAALNTAARPVAGSEELELCFQSGALQDGRSANNAWLQELPDPVTKIAWDNPALISHTLARKHGLSDGSMVRLSAGGRHIDIPVWTVPGQADHTITLTLGYGRTRCGRVGSKAGFDVTPLRTFSGGEIATGIQLEPLGRSWPIACAQDHASMEGRPLVREATLTEFEHHPEFAREMVEHPPLKNLWKEHTYESGYQWGMVIDLNKCIGCNACTVACQSENNIPVVGKEQVAKGREMHWIRLDRYFSGGPDDPEMVHQPVACQHCENAPCEQVCPVAATVHDHEGLNVMAYNRCVGTRYCSNNCPYKARRFNFFDYTKKMPELHKMAQNPDVTVRMRGIMEKCTFCLQRLTLAKNQARLRGEEVKDGQVMTACQQCCPAGAISFGNLLDAESAVAKARDGVRSYAILAELNVRPRTVYAAKIRNKNPEIEG